MEYHDTSADNASFVSALDAARAADPNNGWAVSPQTAEGLQEEGARTFLAADGSSGFAIERSGNIVGVFRNKSAGGQKGVTKIILPLAIENGGTKLDCYGEELVRIYSKFGFYPVARVEFNEQYANPGWDESKGRPDVIFMAHNGDDAATVIRNWDTYHKWAREEIQALPLYDKNGYEDAAAYRDSILERQGRIAPAPPQNNGAGEVATGSAAIRNDNEGGLNNVGIQGRSEIGGGGGQIDRTAGSGPAVGTAADGIVYTGTGQGPVSLSAGHRGGYGRNQAWGVSQETRREGRGKEQQSVIRQRQQAAAENPLVSSAEQGVPMGTEDQTVRIWSEEDWDAEARAGAEYAYQNGVRKVTMVVGLLQVEADGEHCSVNGCINKDTGELFVRADSPRESISEIIEHEVGHLKTNAAKVRAFMEAVKGNYKESAWSKIYETYEQRYADVTDNYAGMTEAEKELYIWEEIQCDAAAFTNKFGARASAYNAEATQTLESGLTTEETVGPGYRFEGGRYSNRETSAATERTNGPGEAAESSVISGKVNEDSVDWKGSREETETAREDRAGVDRRNGPGMRLSPQGNKKSTKQSATSPLSGRPSSQKGSIGTDNQVTAAAELLGVDNISQQSDSVKDAIVKLAEFSRAVKENRAAFGSSKAVTADNLTGLFVKTGVLTRGSGSSAYRTDNGHTLRVSNHSANSAFFNTSDNLSIVLQSSGPHNSFYDAPGKNVVEAVYSKRYLNENPNALQALIADLGNYIATGKFRDSVPGRNYNLSGNTSGILVNGKTWQQMNDEYLDAVKQKDMETAQRMVDEAAKRAGFTIKAYHGTRSGEFYVFDKFRTGQNYGGYNASGGGFDFTTNERFANLWGRKAHGDGEVRVMPVYLKAEKTFYAYRAVAPELADALPENLQIMDQETGEVFTGEEAVERAMRRGADFQDALEENGIDFVSVLQDHGFDSYAMHEDDENIAVYNEDQIKSAEPVTRDDNGNVIPLSERFRTDRAGKEAWKNRDIRFSQEEDDGVDWIGRQEDEDTDFSASDEMTEGETRGPSSALRAPSLQGEGNAVDWLGNREEYSMRSITYIGGGVNINGIKIRGLLCHFFVPEVSP